MTLIRSSIKQRFDKVTKVFNKAYDETTVLLTEAAAETEVLAQAYDKAVKNEAGIKQFHDTLGALLSKVTKD